ncbi:MAG: MATE family efflux transporter [Gammaproteobacteria bacterium]|nr:MAG: MATE family efflux transporter [Gammaproteobacteria bacterium]
MSRAVFLRGSTMGHVLRMTGASTVGLLAMFGVDLVDMYFLTLLGERELAAAVGFAGTLLFFLVSVSIGLQIATGALVARSEGNNNRELAGRYCSSSLFFNGAVSVLISALAFCYLEELLHLLGASGLTLEYALDYARIVIPNMPVLVLGMSAAAATRAIGDARRALWAMLAGSIVNAVLDPILIFGLGLGVEGAALASAASRIVSLAWAWHAVYYVHHLPRLVTLREVYQDLAPILQIGGPAMLTNIATPIGSSFVLKMMSQFGDGAVAGAAIIARVSPVAFAAIFSLSSAVGPIIGQNAGAQHFDRVRGTVRDAMIFNGAYVAVIWLALWLLTDVLVNVFSAGPEAAELMRFFCHVLVGCFVFNGMLFVANASFNNLGKPAWATVFNFARALLGTIPCAYFGAQWFGAKGVLAGEAVGVVLFGVLALVAVHYLVAEQEAHS